MKARTISITYQPGEYYKTQGHKRSERKHRSKAGHIVNPTGFGWATESRPSRIIVGVDVKGKYAEVWVDHFFKDNWGKLTAGRVRAIKDTMPDELKVKKNEGYSGSVYYTADETSMREWLKDAKAAR